MEYGNTVIILEYRSDFELAQDTPYHPFGSCEISIVIIVEKMTVL